MNKYIESVNQDEKHALDLLELIMRPTDPVKEELLRNLMNMDQFGSKIKTKIKVSTSGFWKSDVFPLEANACLLASRF